MIPPWSFSTFIFLSIARWARSSCRLIPDMIQTDKIRYDTTRSESEWMQAGAKIGSPRYAVQEVKRKHRTATSYASWANQQIVDWLHLRTNSGQKYDNWWTLTTDEWIQWRHDLNDLNDLNNLNDFTNSEWENPFCTSCKRRVWISPFYGKSTYLHVECFLCWFVALNIRDEVDIFIRCSFSGMCTVTSYSERYWRTFTPALCPRAHCTDSSHDRHGTET